MQTSARARVRCLNTTFGESARTRVPCSSFCTGTTKMLRSHFFCFFCFCYVHIGARAQAPNPGTKSGRSLGLGFGLGLGLSFGLVYAWTSKQNMNVDDLLSLVNEVPTNTYRHKFASTHISSITTINMQGFYASISITSLVFACLFSSVLHIF